jgi:hypothetical protein
MFPNLYGQIMRGSSGSPSSSLVSSKFNFEIRCAHRILWYAESLERYKVTSRMLSTGPRKGIKHDITKLRHSKNLIDAGPWELLLGLRLRSRLLS